MLTAGAFVAAGDLSGPATAIVALTGAVVGDQIGYAIGRRGTSWLSRLHGKSAEMVGKAHVLIDQYGGSAVFLSRWLLSPLGPYVNVVAGAARMNWVRFSLRDLSGEAVWVAVYLGGGYLFAGQVEAVADIAGNLSGALAAGALTVGLGLWLRAAIRADQKRKSAT
jgi:membrane-associated protein